ncbi:MAG: hypothetical protein R3C53_23980 [Pirellulaceae bacterium]
MNSQLAKHLRAECPRCKKSSKVIPGDSQLHKVRCDQCEHVFHVRVRNAVSQIRVVPPQTAQLPSAIPLDADLPDPLMDFSTSANSWALKSRRNFVNRRALATACAISGALLLTVGMVYALASWDYSNIDVLSIGAVEDSHEKLFRDWTKLVDRQSDLLASIDHQSDCVGLMSTYENLLVQHRALAVRAVKLNGFSATEPFLKGDELPDYPIERSGRRPIEVLLTKEFRQLESQVNNASDAVLHYLVYVASPSRLRLSDLTLEEEQAVEVRVRLLQALARIERPQDADAIGLDVYEIAHQLSSKSDAELPIVLNGANVALPELLHLLDELRAVISQPYLLDSQSGLAKALNAVEAAMGG